MKVSVRPGVFVRTIMEDEEGNRQHTHWIRAEYPQGIENTMRTRIKVFNLRPLYRLRVTYPKRPK